MKEQKIIEGKVIAIINNYKVVINKGKRDGVKLNQIFLVYYLSKEDIIDEDSKENLGKIEYAIGKGKVIHLQEKMATIESIEKVISSKKTIRKNNNIFGLSNEEVVIEPEEDLIGFEDCSRGYLIKSLN